MTNNPLLNALLASAYIALVASILYSGRAILPPEDGILVPITILSLFVLSAAIMGFLFLFQSAQLFLDGERKTAVQLFLQTVGYFAGITLLFLVILFFVSR